jgi:hypothetical protein
MVNLIFISNSNKAYLGKDLKTNFDGFDFIAKKGYKTDGASIPFIFWAFNLHPYQGDTLMPAVFHDLFYQTELYSRASCDNNFLYLMRKNGVGFLKRTAFYIMVRIFGGFVWSRHTVGSVTKARSFLVIKKVVK